MKRGPSQITTTSEPVFRVGDRIRLNLPRGWRPWYVRAWLWVRPLLELYGLGPPKWPSFTVTDIDRKAHTITYK